MWNGVIMVCVIIWTFDEFWFDNTDCFPSKMVTCVADESEHQDCDLVSEKKEAHTVNSRLEVDLVLF